MIEDRLGELEREAARLQQDVAALRSHFSERQQLDALKAENQTLRQAVLRYALACGAVDLQMALVRSRHERTGESVNQLKLATDEEEASSHALRELAQHFQLAAKERNQSGS